MTYNVTDMKGSRAKVISDEFKLAGWGTVKAVAVVRLAEGVTLKDGDRFQLSGKQPLAKIDSLEQLRLFR